MRNKRKWPIEIYFEFSRGDELIRAMREPTVDELLTLLDGSGSCDFYDGHPCRLELWSHGAPPWDSIEGFIAKYDRFPNVRFTDLDADAKKVALALIHHKPDQPKSEPQESTWWRRILG
jgi:hypothetical protein